MDPDCDSAVQRWVAAGLLTPEQAERIRAHEAAVGTGAQRSQWPVIIALSFGGLMVALGVLLFVAAHWDELSPATRMALVACMTALFPLAATVIAPRFPALATTLFALGTACFGASVALTGQIFHLSEHWPGGILLWAAGAWAGWALLRQWPQLALVALLTPAWLTAEWTEAEWVEVATRSYGGAVPATGLLLLSLAYLAASRAPENSVERGTLVWIGGLALLPLLVACALTGGDALERGAYYDPWIAVGWVAALALPLVVWGIVNRPQIALGVAAAGWCVALSFLSALEETPLPYLWCALGMVGLVAWGLRDGRAERINLGIAGFALTTLTYFFSHVFDQLGRSASLIALGLLFLGGGWYLERLRRRLVAQAGVRAS